MWKFETEKYLKDGVLRSRSSLHYDHNEARTGYLGFSHGRCNMLAGARRGGLARLRGRALRHSRTW
jgi:hypothetical protein